HARKPRTAGQVPFGVNSIAFSQDGQRFGCACSQGTIYIWDFLTKKVIQKLLIHKDHIYSNLCSLAFSPHGRLFTVCEERGQVAVYETATGKKVRTFTVELDRSLRFGRFPLPPSLVFSADGNYLAAAWDSLHVW